VADTITVTYKVKEDGSLEKVAQKANKAAAATDKATKASAGHNKVQKGVAQTGLSSAKSFSKMSSSIEGGLVPAYATLAAHVFAVTAAFGILSRSQAVKQLNEGLLFTGRAAGENLTIVTKNLREITENAVSSADAMRALAVGVSAGFSEGQMEGLTKVAKGASLALGRDMTDALDRLVRGAAKLEPEILDELGIMVRLDDATEKYAASIGVAAGELTQFERRMAFTNAIIEQGESKFGALSASVASNPFNQLSATFDDMVKAGMNFVNFVAGPIAGFLAGNMGALIATMGVLGTGVVNMMVPALTQAGKASAEMAQQMAKAAKETIATTKATKGSPAIFTKLSKKMADGTASAKDLTDAQNSLKKSVKSHQSQLPGMIASHGEESDVIQKKKLVIQENEMALYKLTGAQEMETLSTQKAAQADILAAASAGQFKLTIQLLRAEMLRESIQLKISNLEKGFLAAAYARVTMWAGFATLSVKAFGLALLQSIPIIGQVILISMLLWEGIKWLFGSDAEETVNPLAKVLEEGKERFEEFPNIINQMAESYEMASNASERYLISLKAQNGLMKQTLTHVRDLRIAESVNQGMDLAAAQRKLAAAKETEASARALLDKAGVSNTAGEEIGFFGKLKERVVGHRLRGGVSSEDRVGAVTSMNQALEDQARLTGQIAQLEAAAAGPSEERLLSTEEAFRTLSLTLQSGLSAVDKGSEEFQLMTANIAEVDTILSTLSAETIGDAEESLVRLSREVNKTEASFQALKDAGAEVEALFAKETAVSGMFSDQIKVLDKGLAAIVRTLNSDIQTAELAAAFEKFGVSNEEELQSLRDRYAAMNQYRKEESYWAQMASNRRGALNNAGLKDVALLELQSDQEFARTALIEERALAIKAGEDGLKQDLALLKLASKEEKTRLDLIRERVSEHARLGGETLGGMMSVVGKGEENQETYGGASGSDKIKMLGEAVAPMVSQLEKLGPEGLLVSAVVEGSLIMGEAFTAFSEKLTAGTATTSDGLALAAAGMATLGNIASAASNAKIAGIDAEISAEKKRDGVSAASVAKMAALEKKKEGAKRKAFEQNKKIQMASVVLSTAAAAMAAWAPPPVGAGPLFGGALTAGIVALGAAQLAIIAGTSYAGGGASVGGGGSPAQVSVGSRNASVDLAKGNNAGGELAYNRGEQGIGTGMSDFKPAFSGYKHRAGGGYVVGEQGPELFMPETPGNIIPSGQGSGGPTNVNFSISAVDASGVEELLMNQRGAIIGMIREAANEHGEFFLESVQEKSY
tara:strand:+ start:778 stop:4602 length:3825 start_codon:yes stop_codon:yes gene_type:complete